MQTLPLSSSWEDDWQFQAHGKYTGRADRRGVFSMSHPWEESSAGDYGQITRRVTWPGDWHGPRVLSFMAADSHHGREYIPDEWVYSMDVDIFVGHRFSQILINGQVAWEMDVAETDSPIEHLCSLTTDNMKEIGLFWGPGTRRYPSARFGAGVKDPPPYFDVYHFVDLADRVQPGESFDLTLRVYDRVGSAEVLADDVHGVMSEKPVDNRSRFQMIAWWADLCLVNERKAVESTFSDRITLDPVIEAAPAGNLDSVEMHISRGETLPPVPFPIWGGVPFPRDALYDSNAVRLTTMEDGGIPVQTRVLSRWSGDGSVQWLDLTCVVPPGVRKVMLHYGEGQARPSSGASENANIAVSRADGLVTVDAGAVALSIRQGSASLMDSFRAAGGPELGPVKGILNQQMLGDIYSHKTVISEVEVEEEGPVRASIALRGTLDDGQGHIFGRFTARVRVWAGSPLISLTFRVFQDMEQPVPIVHELLLEMGSAGLRDVQGAFTDEWHGPMATRRLEELELRQEQAHEFKVTGIEELQSGEHAPGWMGAQGLTSDGAVAGVGCGVRWFWQQCPKTLTLAADKLTVGLFGKRRRIEWTIDAGPTSVMTRGEAKRHSLWLMPHVGEQRTDVWHKVQAAWDARPHLLNREWFAASKVLGNLVPFPSPDFPETEEWLKKLDQYESSKDVHGVRDWRETMWCQNYRGRAANALLLYFASGKGEWQDYFEQVMSHNLDVDTIHCAPGHADWVGAPRGFGPFHTLNLPGWHISSNCQEQFLHYSFAGEPDSLGEAELAAKYIARQSGNQDRSARYEGWPLAQMSIAYTWTGDDAYLKSAGEFLRYAHLYTHPRRGAYDEVHGSFSHRGIVPFMTGYLGYGLMRYHAATEDERAAKLLVALSEAAASEATDGKGGYRYSPDPRLSAPHEFPPALNIGGMLAYSYRLTGDAWFARQAMLCYDRHKQAGLSNFASLDMSQSVGELLSGIALARQRGDLNS